MRKEYLYFLIQLLFSCNPAFRLKDINQSLLISTQCAISYTQLPDHTHKHKRETGNVLARRYSVFSTHQNAHCPNVTCPSNWEKLTDYEKKQHTRTNCEACYIHQFLFQSLFPTWNNQENSITQQGIHKTIKSRVLKPSCCGNVKVTKKAPKTVTYEFMKKSMPHLKIHLG